METGNARTVPRRGKRLAPSVDYTNLPFGIRQKPRQFACATS
jgi:hypothetical protein